MEKVLVYDINFREFIKITDLFIARYKVDYNVSIATCMKCRKSRECSVSPHKTNKLSKLIPHYYVIDKLTDNNPYMFRTGVECIDYNIYKRSLFISSFTKYKINASKNL